MRETTGATAAAAGAEAKQRAVEKLRTRKTTVPLLPSGDSGEPLMLQDASSVGPLVPNQLSMDIKLSGMAHLKPVETRVVLLRDFVGNGMFIAE